VKRIKHTFRSKNCRLITLIFSGVQYHYCTFFCLLFSLNYKFLGIFAEGWLVELRQISISPQSWVSSLMSDFTHNKLRTTGPETNFGIIKMYHIGAIFGQSSENHAFSPVV